MAAVETPPVEEVEIEVISVVEMGRAIHILRAEKIYTSTSSSWGGRYRTKKAQGRRFTDVQIGHILGLTLDEMNEYDAAFTSAVIRRWPIAQQVDAVVAFAKRTRRWPTDKDFQNEAELPASSTWYANSGPTRLNNWLVNAKNARSLHPQLLLGIKNVEIRQRAIEAAGGTERLIRKGGAKKLQQDDYGILWQMTPEPDVAEKQALWLEVVNATEESDGTREHFFLRVPPTMTTAKEAVEWSFSIPAGMLEQFEVET